MCCKKNLLKNIFIDKVLNIYSVRLLYFLLINGFHKILDFNLIAVYQGKKILNKKNE